MGRFLTRLASLRTRSSEILTDLEIDSRDSPAFSRRTISSGEILGSRLGFDGWRNLGTYGLSEIFLVFRTGFCGLRYHLMRALSHARILALAAAVLTYACSGAPVAHL
jgi:hypothetical protein